METSLLQLEGKSALIVGGGEGISLSTARLLAEAGCGVAVADIDAGRGDSRGGGGRSPRPAVRFLCRRHA